MQIPPHMAIRLQGFPTQEPQIKTLIDEFRCLLLTTNTVLQQMADKQRHASIPHHTPSHASLQPRHDSPRIRKLPMPTSTDSTCNTTVIALPETALHIGSPGTTRTAPTNKTSTSTDISLNLISILHYNTTYNKPLQYNNKHHTLDPNQHAPRFRSVTGKHSYARKAYCPPQALIPCGMPELLHTGLTLVVPVGLIRGNEGVPDPVSHGGIDDSQSSVPLAI